MNPWKVLGVPLGFPRLHIENYIWLLAQPPTCLSTTCSPHNTLNQMILPLCTKLRGPPISCRAMWKVLIILISYGTILSTVIFLQFSASFLFLNTLCKLPLRGSSHSLFSRTGIFCSPLTNFSWLIFSLLLGFHLNITLWKGLTWPQYTTALLSFFKLLVYFTFLLPLTCSFFF